MEYTQWVKRGLESEVYGVLILVVMEYTQWERILKENESYECLNPCCNGIYSMSMRNAMEHSAQS